MNYKKIAILSMLGCFLLAEVFAIFNPSKTNNEAGLEAFAKEDYTNALASFEQALKHSSKDLLILNNVAATLHKIGDYEASEKLYRKSLDMLSLKKNKKLKMVYLSKLYYNLGNNYFASQNYVEALAAYKISLEANDADIQAKKNLELTLSRLDEQVSQDLQDQINDETGSGGASKEKPKRIPESLPGEKKEESSTENQKKNNNQENNNQNNNNEKPSEDARASDLPKTANNSATNNYNESPLSRERADQILKSLEQKNIDLRQLQPFQYPRPLRKSKKNW